MVEVECPCDDDSNMEPYERARATVSVQAVRSGTRTIVASFHSKELGGITGSTEINVIEPEKLSIIDDTDD